MADGKVAHSKVCGDMALRTTKGNCVLHLRKVFYVPKFRNNIISVSKLLQDPTCSIQVTSKTLVLKNRNHKLTMNKGIDTEMWYFFGHRLSNNLKSIKPSVYATEIVSTNENQRETNDKQTNNRSKNINKNKTNLIYLDFNITHDRFGHFNEPDLRRTTKQYGITLTGQFLTL